MVSAIYLNKANREELLAIIHAAVVEKYDGVEFRRQVADLGNKAEKMIHELIESEYPQDEMRILQKWGAASDYSFFKIDIQVHKETNEPLYVECVQFINRIFHSSKSCIEIAPILIPGRKSNFFHLAYENNEELNRKYERFSCGDSPLLELGWILHVRECEISDIMKAYEQRLEGIRTLKQLVENYQDMIPFANKLEVLLHGEQAEKEIPEAEKKIKAFMSEESYTPA